ncbi:pyruvate kinase [Mahella sp.]|uniref:pyruvate kinase n=1 Tax=Mahella sp. TaxID=2798721 RepID=UPI0025C323F9|nr:pyruvate kinase [Mahella sp.]MBZ4664763.1 pyruvate kinase [Mahella sp.]
MRKTKIICTIGPASDDKAVFERLIAHGTNAIRLNFSHGSYEEHGKRIDMAKNARRSHNIPLSIILDTKGPEMRLGKFKIEPVELKEGQSFTLTTRDIEGDNSIVSVNYAGLTKDIKQGDKLLLDDGLIELRVKDIDGTDIHCTVMNSGLISSKKSVNAPGISIQLPSVTQKDIDDIKFGIEKGIDTIAASFIRRAEDVLGIKKILEDNNAYDVQIIAKIENQEGINNLDDIMAVADGIMIARGDLGVEIPTEDVPVVQKAIISKCRDAGKPVVIATQMLDSMIRNPRPTRAEATDVANAIYEGADAIMLSGETASGKYPVEALTTMIRIAERVERSLNCDAAFYDKAISSASITNAISHATCTIARDLGARAIITATKSGYTARMVAKYRPVAPIIATTISEMVYNKLSLVWGVVPFLTSQMEGTDEMIEQSVDTALESELISSGDLVVITAGVPVGVSGTTNLIKVHIAGDILVKGVGFGVKAVYGRVCSVKNYMDAKTNFKDGDILVAKSTDNTLLPFMRRASAIITEESGIASHAAVVGLTLEIPVVVGAQEATEILTDGIWVTVDPQHGFVYNGKAAVI